MTPEFDMKKVTTPILLYLLGQELRLPRLLLLRCKLTLGRFKRTIDARFPEELVDLAALPAWVYLNLRKRVGQHRAFEIMRVALLTGGTAAQNLQFDTVRRERTFRGFSELEIENNRTGLVRWNSMEVVERSTERFEIKITRCMFHEFAVSLGIGELTPVVCQIDNAMFNSYLPDEMTFDLGPHGRRIADGKRECNFVWQLHSRPGSPVGDSLDDRRFHFHEESVALANAPVDRVFDYLDDPKALAAHMGESSMMMMGSRMSIDVDADGGRRVGSKIRMEGRVMGIRLSLEEVITERSAPSMKVWETIGTPNLLVLANYRMGFDLTRRGDSSLLRVFIDYSLPAHAPGSWLGRLLGGAYARWCTKQMAHDAARHFNAGTADGPR